MNRIEIRQRKKILVPIILLCWLAMLSGGYVVFFAEQSQDSMFGKISFFIGVGMLCFITYSPMKKILNDQPIIVLDDESIVINSTRRVVISKWEILEIEVVNMGEDGRFLNIKTIDAFHETNISWLEKTPDEISELIKHYRRRS